MPRHPGGGSIAGADTRSSGGRSGPWPAVGKLRQLGPTRVAQVVVEKLRLLAHLLHAVRKTVVDVLLHKLWPLELLAGEWTEPLVLGQLLAVGHHELLQLVGLRFEAELEGFPIRQKQLAGSEDGLQFFLCPGDVDGHSLRAGRLGWLRPAAADMEEAAAVGHVVLGGILGSVVVVHTVDQPQVEEELVQGPAHPRILDRGPGTLLRQDSIRNLQRFAVLYIL